MPNRWIAALCALAAAGAAAAGPLPIGEAQTDTALARHTAMIAQVNDLLHGARAAEALPIAAQVIRETDARLVGEKRHVYSGQSTDMVLANMLAAAAQKEDAVDVGPPLGEALFAEGYALIEVGRRDEAGPFLDRAVAVSPNNPEYLCEAAAWHAGRRDLEAATGLYGRCAGAAGFAPGEADRAKLLGAAQRGQGYVLTEQGRYEEAEAVYRARLKAQPDDEQAKSELRYIRQQRGKAGRQAI